MPGCGSQLRGSILISRLTLAVGHLSCTGCELRVSAVLARLDGIDRVVADHRTGTVTVDYDPFTVDTRTITQRLASADYEPAEDPPR